MSTNDYVKFVTQQFVSYMDSPKQERKQKREERRNVRDPFLVRWFGILPLSLALLYKELRMKQENRKKRMHKRPLSWAFFSCLYTYVMARFLWDEVNYPPLIRCAS
ncbi:hypothetical protein GCM10020331_040210 [Ectobacillus funiculus]